MVGRPSTRQETEIEMSPKVLSTQTALPSLAASAGGSVLPSVSMSEIETVGPIGLSTSGPTVSGYYSTVGSPLDSLNHCR